MIIKAYWRYFRSGLRVNYFVPGELGVDFCSTFLIEFCQWFLQCAGMPNKPVNRIASVMLIHLCVLAHASFASL